MGFGPILILGSKGIPTGFSSAIFSFRSKFSMYFPWDILRYPGIIVTSMPIILLGSPRSVACHLDSIDFFICSIIALFDAKSIRSSTHTVIIPTWSPSHRTYAHESDVSLLYPWLLIFSSSCLFHSRPDCLSPYRVFISLQTLPVPSPNTSSCFMWMVSCSIPFRYAPFICLTFSPLTGTRAKHAHKVSARTTGEYVSVNLCPGHCAHPFTTSRALWCVT